jgi:peroxiredoxin
MRAQVILGALALTLTARAAADEAKTPSGHSIHGEAFDEGPRQAATLLAGMGTIVFPVTTASREAQAFFVQGMAQIHTFYYFEAERSFRQAAVHDSQCAMAYWGMALANQNNRRRAAAFAGKADQRAGSASDRERKYIEAMKAFVAEGKNDDERRAGYIHGLEAVILAHPDDVEAKALLAWALVSGAGGKLGSRVVVNQLIEEILRQNPLHPGAHHYRIHLWDGNDPAQALASAEAYARAAPGIAHAWHMPGHIYNGLGRWQEAAHTQDAAARVDHARMLATATLPFTIHNYVHNQHYLIANLLHLGRAQEALALARNLIEEPRDPERNHQGDRGHAGRLGRFCLMKTCVRFELWDEVLSERHLDWSDIPEERAWEAYAKGLARLYLGDLDEARSHAGRLDEIAAEAAKKPGWDADLIETTRSELRGRLLVAEGKTLEGFALLDKGAKLQVEKFDGDLGPYPRPFHEALGYTHLAARNWGLAEACFRQVLDKRKDTVASAAGLVAALHGKGDRQAALEAHGAFLAAARSADPDLPCERRIEPIALALAAGPDARDLTGGPPTATAAVGSAADLEALGPPLWVPSAAPDFELAGLDGATLSLAGGRGKYLVLIFYLGGACPHCIDQLKAFGKVREELRGLGAEVAGASDDPPEKIRELLAGPAGKEIPFPLFSDPGRRVAKLYGTHDTFEDLPLHGVILIDRRGKIRWSRAGAAPFTDAAFVVAEIKRLEACFQAARQARI